MAERAAHYRLRATCSKSQNCSSHSALSIVTMRSELVCGSPCSDPSYLNSEFATDKRPGCVADGKNDLHRRVGTYAVARPGRRRAIASQPTMGGGPKGAPAASQRRNLTERIRK